MKKNEIFTFTAPNGVEVTGIALYRNYHFEDNGFTVERWLCYAQNRLIICEHCISKSTEHDNISLDEVIVDYAILPDYDDMLEKYSDHLVTMAEEQSGM